MGTTIDGSAASRAGAERDPWSNDALLERSVDRLRALVPRDPELQASLPSAEAVEAVRRTATSIEAVAKAFELYAERPCLGERAFEIVEGATRLLPNFRTVRYADVWARVVGFASGLAREGLAERGAFVGICGFGSTDWVVADLACLYLAAVSVPLQTTLSPSELRQIIQETELRCLVCSVEELDLVRSVLADCPTVRAVVVMDVREGDRGAEERVAAHSKLKPPRLETMRSIEARGKAEGPVPIALPSSRGETDPLITLVYTSGSTGTPKGAMMPESVWRRLWTVGFFSGMSDAMRDVPNITLNYMPLNHMAGRGHLMQSLTRGGLTHFVARPDMSTLFEDIQLARPTTELLVPRVASAIYQEFQSELVRRSSGVTDESERARIASQIMTSMRSSFLGERLVLVTVGSAPTPPDVEAFLKRCFEVPVVDGYGSTEAGPLTLDGRVPPSVGLAWKLVDVPELGYRTTDVPCPRGELLVKSPYVTPGYYKNERATRELFDDDGFLKTGDIVEQRSPDRLVWIDRARNILKLSQGEFVATSRLEGLFASRSPFLRQVYLYGNGLRPYLLAVVVPEIDAANEYFLRGGKALDDTLLKELVRGEFQRIAHREKLRGYETPRDFLVEHVPFTVENGLLTSSNKPSRPKLRDRYGERLEAMYDAIERTQLEELDALRARPGATVAERVKRAVAVTLGLPETDLPSTDRSFLQLGGDSLSAVRLAAVIDDACGVRVPVGFLLDPTSNVQAVIDWVESALTGKAPRRSVAFEDVHGKGATVVRASDLRLDKFLSPDELHALQTQASNVALPSVAEVALLTGANGFLGRFLVLDLLEQLEGDRKRLYAIVRAPSDEAARDRLASTYGTDPALAAKFDALTANGRLVVLAGDLIKPHFGLSDSAYARLTEEVDCIVHNGALVNHAFGYEELFDPNVLGTVEMIRFALARRRKSLAYVSTVGVVNGIPRKEPIREDEDAWSLVTERPTESGYAAGYAASKWASELLLHDAHERFGLSVLVFRPSEIMAHTEYRGQVNVPDFFTRLLAGIVYTGVAPASFYEADVPVRARHYDGLPVDVVSRSIVAPSVVRAREGGPKQGWEVYHVVNPHQDDGISLDLVVDWVQSAGYRVERIADYGTWYRTFRDRLLALNDVQRQHSPLPILKAWARPQAERWAGLDDTRLLERLRAISPDFAELPHVSEVLIHKYLDDLAFLHVIERPLRLAG